MSNRFGERINPSGGSPPPGTCQNVQNCPGTVLNVFVTNPGTLTNIAEWGGVAVTPAAVKKDDVPSDGLTSPVVPEIGAILEIFDGFFLQRARATIDRILSVAEFYFSAGQNPSPPFPVTKVDDSLRVKGAETLREVHIPEQVIPLGGTTQPAYAIPAGVREITFWVVITPNPAAGFNQELLVFHWGNGTEEGIQTVLDTTLTVLPNGEFARQSIYMQEVAGPNLDVATFGATPYTMVIPVRVPVGATSVRVVVSEKADPVNRPTLLVTLASGT
jgi:hypothetical protein